MKKLLNRIALSVTLAILLIIGLACSAPEASQPENETWISPGKILVNNVKLGDTVKQTIKIHNGSDTTTGFLVYYRIPDYVEGGYVAASLDARDWITVAESSPAVGPRQTQEIEIVLKLPDGAQTPQRWEFWIGVRENKENSLTTELASRWLVSMKSAR